MESPEDFLRRHRASRVEPLTDRLVRTILEQNPGYRSTDVVPVPDLWESCRDNIARVLGRVAGEVAGGLDGDSFAAAEHTGRRRAEQGLPLDDVLRSFRLGGRLIWEDLIEQSRATDALDADALREVGTRLWEVVDVSSAHVASAYHATERAQAMASEQRSAALWEGLLAGRSREPAFAVAAARTLRLPLHGDLLVVVASGALDEVDRRLAARGIASAWHRRTDQVVGILAVGATGPAAALEVLRAGSRVRGGVSRVCGRFADVVDAFGQAGLALRTLEPGEPRVVCFDERLVEELLLTAPQVADRLVEVWLGPVLRLPAAESRVLVDTLQAWVDAGGSMTRTAQRASCHRNTAINRVARAGALLGIALTDGPVPVELALALRSLRLARG